MKARNPNVSSLNTPILSHEPESMQKYSDEMRERIAMKAYDLYEKRGRQAERDLEDWLQAEELLRKEVMEA